MARNISFMLTTEQVRKQQKTVTRRLGWQMLKQGDELNACVKCMGLKQGEKIERLAKIRVEMFAVKGFMTSLLMMLFVKALKVIALNGLLICSCVKWAFRHPLKSRALNLNT